MEMEQWKDFQKQSIEIWKHCNYKTRITAELLNYSNSVSVLIILCLLAIASTVLKENLVCCISGIVPNIVRE